jgi:hypothetical protein
MQWLGGLFQKRFSLYISGQLLKALGDAFSDEYSKHLPPVFSNMSRVVEFIDRISPAPSQQVRKAALFAALLKTRGALSALRLINAVKDLVPALDCEQHIQLSRLVNHMRKGIDHAVVAGAVSVAWHATASRQGNKTRTLSLLKMMSSLAASDDQCAMIAKIAVEIMTQAEPEIAGNNRKDSVLFSISIDLAGSTQAKTEAMTVSPNNQQRINEVNIEILRHFLKVEQDFYRQACSQYSEGGGLEPRLFFSVKGIGDEIWILAESDRLKALEAGRSLIDAALQICTNIIRHIAVENDDGPSWHPGFDYGRIQPLALGIKVFIDTVENATDISAVRDEAIRRFVPEILRQRLGRNPNECEIGEVLDRLILGGFESAGWLGYYRHRSDFIGHEIDRFFRTSKAAIPGMVVIGESMANLLKLQFRDLDKVWGISKSPKSLRIRCPVRGCKKFIEIKVWQALSPLLRVPIIGRILRAIWGADVFQVFLADDRPLRGGIPRDCVYAVTQILRAEELKGIGKDYRTFALFAPRSLKEMLVYEEADQKHGFRTFPLDTVRSLLSDGALQLLVDAEVARDSS